MSTIEYTVIGAAFAACAAILFLGAVPYYTIRHVGPGKPPPLPRGGVTTAGFGLVDVIGVTLFFGWYATNWLAARGGEGTGGLAESENLSLLLLAQLALQAFMVAAVLCFLYWRMNIARAFGLGWSRWYVVLIIAPLTVFVSWSFMAGLEQVGYNQWITSLVGGDGRQDAVKLLGDESISNSSLALMVLVACVGAPLAEEVVFRGYLYPALKRFSNIPVAVLFTGLLFGAVHLNLAALLPLTFLGVALALLYEATGSLWAPIATHFLFNAGTVAVQFAVRADKLPDHAAFIGLG